MPMKRYLVILLFILTSTTTILAQDNLLEVSVSNSRPFAGEIITYSLRFLSTLDISEAQIQLPQFVAFAQQPQPATRTTETRNSVILNVLQQNITLYANTDGNFTIEPTTIIVPDTPFQSGVEINSDAITVTVRELPETKPETFTGAVGQFDLRVTLEPPVIQAGEPNLLRISITGSGNFSQITAPVLNLPSTWDIFNRPASISTTGNNLSTKTFEYQFFTDQTGEIQIPPILFTFFDPLTASYKTITGQAGNIVVEGEFTNTSQQNTPTISRLALKPMNDRPENLLPASNFWLLWLIPPIIVILMSVFRFFLHPKQSTEQKQTRKQSKSLQAVTNQLTQARQHDPNQVSRIVEQTILQYLSARYQADITIDQLPVITSNLPSQLQQQLLICIEQAQTGQYAPITTTDADKLIRRTYRTLQKIEEVKIR